MNGFAQLQAVPRLAPLALTLGLAALLSGCGGAGGNAVPDVDPGPPPANTTPPPSPPQPAGVTPTPFADAAVVKSVVTGLEIPGDGRPVVEFFVTDGQNVAIEDLGTGDVRFALAKFVPGPLGASQGDWQSYLNRIETPTEGVGTESAPRLQATAERASSGTLEHLGEGRYRYTFALDVTAPDAALLAQAEAEGLDLAYEPERTHRVALQFGGGRQLNPYLDVQPSTGALDGIPRGLVTTVANCNGCHDRLAIHGGGRVEIEYCVTCHNPGTTDANNGNSLDMGVMTHRIHRGAFLPSVQAGGRYEIYGFRDSLHDYSDVIYPGDVRDCAQCHAGSATETALTTVVTAAGDNWSEYPTRAGCGSCHDDLDFTTHAGGQSDDLDCRSCHSAGGVAGSVAANHVDPIRVAGARYRYEILGVSATARGEFPVVDFRIVDPTNGDAPWDILADAPFTQPMGASRIAVTVGWDTADYTNHGSGAEIANTVSINALTSATANGDGSFRVTSPVAIPDATLAPFIATTGSGAITIEGHPGEEIDGSVESIPVTNVHAYFSVNEPGGEGIPRREVSAIAQCNACHTQLSIHGGNRTDDLAACVTCHNPRNTDGRVRPVAVTPPTDGKAEESIDFKTMIHGIHASGFRENPLQIVGFRGFTTYVYDEEHVQYPGILSNCTSCHLEDSYMLPLPDGVLGTSVDTGTDKLDPTDDRVATPASAVCASCHDGADAIAHMTLEGGDFDTTQAFIDQGTSAENCAGCHGPGELAAVDLVHGLGER